MTESELARIVLMLREWETSKVLKKLTPETRSAIPAIEELRIESADSDLRFLATEALRKIHAADPGNW